LCSPLSTSRWHHPSHGQQHTPDTGQEKSTHDQRLHVPEQGQPRPSRTNPAEATQSEGVAPRSSGTLDPREAVNDIRCGTPVQALREVREGVSSGRRGAKSARTVNAPVAPGSRTLLTVSANNDAAPWAPLGEPAPPSGEQPMHGRLHRRLRWVTAQHRSFGRRGARRRGLTWATV
jgi:hypothetical protein